MVLRMPKFARLDGGQCWTLALIAGLWVASDLGYYLALPKLWVAPNYNADPIAIATYYFYWTGVAVILFWRIYAPWPKICNWGHLRKPFRQPRSVVAVLYVGDNLNRLCPADAAHLPMVS